jgi:sulfatase-like protein
MTQEAEATLSRTQAIFAGFSVALLLVGSIFILNPWTIYQSNIHEFNLPLGTLLGTFLPWVLTSMAIVIVVFGISARIPKTKRIAALISMVTLALWIQSNLLTFSYGKLDGSALDFASNTWRLFYEIPFWCTAIALALWRPRFILRNTSFVSLLLVALQFIPILTTSERAEQITRTPGDIPNTYYDYSSDKNVLHLVLDEFGGRLMEEILANRPDLASHFDGFTFYRDTTGLFPTTNVSMHAVFTGNIYDYSEPLATYIGKDLPTNGLPVILAQQGYDTNLVAKTYLCHRIGRECRIVPGVSKEDKHFNQSIHLLDLSLFRALPHLFKSHVYRDGNWLLMSEMGRGDPRFQTLSYQAVAFLETAISETHLTSDIGPQYNMYHVALPHLPTIADAECNFIGKQPFEKASFLVQAECATLLTTQLMERLKNLGVYDNTEIIIHSDHGSWFDVTKVPLVSETTPIAWDMSRASALLMHKPRNSRGELVVSSAQASLADIRPTLLAADEIDASSSNFGLNLADIDSSTVRERSYWAFSWKGVLAERDYLPEAKHFVIVGDHYDQANWNYVGSESGKCDYELDTDIKLIADAPSPPFCISIGMSQSETHHTWTNGNRVYVQFNLDKENTNQPLVMKLQAAPFMPDDTPLRFTVNSRSIELGAFELTDDQLVNLSVEVPAELVLEKMDFEILIENPRRPIDLGINGDKRALGLRLTKWSLSRS